MASTGSAAVAVKREPSLVTHGPCTPLRGGGGGGAVVTGLKSEGRLGITPGRLPLWLRFTNHCFSPLPFHVRS